MSEGDAAPAAAPAPAGLPPGDAGPVTMPNPPSIEEALAVNDPAIAQPSEHEKRAKEKPEGDKPDEKKADDEEKPEVKDEEGEEPKKKLPGSQRLKRQVARMEAEYEAAQREIAELRQRVLPKDNPQGQAGVDRAPTEADFPNDYVAYDRALQAWNAEQAIERAISRRELAAKEARAATAQREAELERLEAYEESAELARERIPDFDKVVRSAKDVNVKPAVIEEILASDKSALLQYHLAQNPDKVRELNGMTGRELAREIGRLESRVHLPTAKKATEAPKPLESPKGGAAAAFNPRTASMDEYAQARKSGWTGK